MSKHKKQMFTGVIVSFCILLSVTCCAPFAFAASDSDAYTFTIKSGYEKKHSFSEHVKGTMTSKFTFGSTWKADQVESIITSSNSTSVSAKSVWTSKVAGTSKTKTDTGSTGASALCKGIVGSATKATRHEYTMKNSSNSYTYIASGSR